MTFDKKDYQKRRKQGMRGQDTPKAKKYPKGDTVPYVTREDIKAEYPNAIGEHMTIGRGFINRTQHREKLPRLKGNTRLELLRKEQRAARHERHNAGEHERAVKKHDTP